MCSNKFSPTPLDLKKYVPLKQKATIVEQQDTSNKNRVGCKEKRETRTEEGAAIGEHKTADFEQEYASNEKQGVRGD